MLHETTLLLLQSRCLPVQLINMFEELNVQCLKVLLMALGSWLHFAWVFFIDEICVTKYVHTEFDKCLNLFWIRMFYIRYYTTKLQASRGLLKSVHFKKRVAQISFLSFWMPPKTENAFSPAIQCYRTRLVLPTCYEKLFQAKVR